MSTARLTAIVQARMSSSRAPGKMLRPVAGKPVLQYVLERLQHCSAIGDVIVGTSTDPTDDPIASFCKSVGVAFARGPLDDVAGRFAAILEQRHDPVFVRICGDRAMLDTSLIKHAAALHTASADVVTNACPASFPAGQTVELVNTAAFLATYPKMTEPGHREHVTAYFYKYPAQFRIINFRANMDFANVHLAIDTEADLRNFESIVSRMTRPHWTYGLGEIVELYRAVTSR